MAIPITYNLRSMVVRLQLFAVAVLAIAGTVSVFIAVLALARGFRAAVVSSGSAANVMVLRQGSSTEASSVLNLDQVPVIDGLPGVARAANGPLVDPEVLSLAPFPLRETGTDANVQVRGVSANVLQVRQNIHMREGRFLQPGTNEVIVGRNIPRIHTGLSTGDTVKFGGGVWHVVGVFDGAGSSFDSEVWCDGHLLNQVYHRPDNLYNSITVRLTSPDALQRFKDAATSDPRLTIDAVRETEYYDRQSQTFTTLIMSLGSIIVLVMGIGAILSSLNIMYATVAERSREIATLRALGFGVGSIVTSFVLEALLISLFAGAIGCLLVLPINGLTTRSMNPVTFSQLSYSFQVTPALLLQGVLFALVMGIVGGLPPAIRAATSPIAKELRSL